MLQFLKKVAQKLLQNLHVDFHIFYKKLLISLPESLVLLLLDSWTFNSLLRRLATFFITSVHYLTQQTINIMNF